MSNDDDAYRTARHDYFEKVLLEALRNTDHPLGDPKLDAVVAVTDMLHVAKVALQKEFGESAATPDRAVAVMLAIVTHERFLLELREAREADPDFRPHDS
jgi:hypothetical protein